MTSSVPPRCCWLALAALGGLLHAGGAQAAEPGADASPQPAPVPGSYAACAQVRVDAERLACYDRIVAPQVRGAPEAVAPASENGATAPSVLRGGPADASSTAASTRAPGMQPSASYLDEFWELSPERKRGTFNFSGFRPNYFLPVHVTSGTNRTPSTPAPDHAGQLPPYERVEAKLQISVRTKLAEGLLLPDADLWFAYTQQSLWQLYSGGISRPFRSTDHEPELFYIVPTRVGLPLGWRLQMVGLGLAHQSNGQSLPFSRSWNRWYALAGIENGDVALTARYNQRIHESDGNDDNPDLTSYRGRTELIGLWSPGFSTLTATWRTNFDRRGSLQLDWTLPVSRKDPKGLRWYAQVFSGYGETLIDYNYRQTSFGAGVTLFGW
jgi:phospholipase A1